MRITVLGSGTSFGVPVIGCSCAVCRSPDPRDRRLRASAFVLSRGVPLLIDAGPEFRIQALAAGIERVEALLLTHAHADHCHGMDDLRPLTGHEPLPVYANEEAVKELRVRFEYAFRTVQKGASQPRFDFRVVRDKEFEIPAPEGRLRVQPLPLLHGGLPVLGFRIGDFAYVSDCSGIPESSRALLQGLKVLVIDGLRMAPHPTHFTIDEAMAAAEDLGVPEVWLTHLNHEHAHAWLEDYCAAGSKRSRARPAWDGLRLEIPEPSV